MAWTFGFHNSVNHDRVYNADQMSGIFEGLITDGVYEAVGNKLAVQPNSGMVIQIATGRGWFNGRWVNNSSPHLLTLDGSDVLLNRYAAICVRGDNTDGVRATQPYVKYSEFATNPVKPTMVRTDTIKEYCLAYVYIRAGATAITAADIEDTRQDTNLCGWVTGLIDQITPETLYTQFTAQFKEFYNESTTEFNEWFSGLVDDLNPNTEAMLVAALPTSLTATLRADGWTQSGNEYTYNLAVSGVTTTKSILVQPNNDTVEAYLAAGIKAVSQGANSLIFTANTAPTTDVRVDILHMGK